MKKYYTDKEYKELKSHIVLLHQTNEQKNDHIIAWWDSYNIKHEGRALKTGDYCFKIEQCEELGFDRDTYFIDELCIERKNSVDELASCMNNIAFHNEIRRMGKIKNAYLIVEDDSLTDIIEGNYRSQYNKNSFLRTLLHWCMEYNIHLLFVPRKYMGKIIAEICVKVLDQNIFKLSQV